VLLRALGTDYQPRPAGLVYPLRSMEKSMTREVHDTMWALTCLVIILVCIHSMEYGNDREHHGLVAGSVVLSAVAFTLLLVGMR